MSDTIHLLRKDLLLLLRYAWIILLFAFVFSGLFGNSPQIGLLPAMLFILNMNADIRSTGRQFIVTLPVPRATLVLAKYVSSVLLVTAGLAISMAVNWIGAKIQGIAFGFEPAYLGQTLLFLIILAAVYTPLYYWLSSINTFVINVVFIILMTIGNQVVYQLYTGAVHIGLVKALAAYPLIGPAIAAIITLALLIGSYHLSKNIYLRKDI